MTTAKRLWFFYFSLALCWASACYADLGRQWSEGRLVVYIDFGTHTDFLEHYGVSLLARESLSASAGQKCLIYDPESQLSSINRILAPFALDKLLYVPYPPSFFLVMLPLTFLPINGAWLLWALTAACAIAWSGYFVASRYYKTFFPRLLIVILIFAANPTWYAFRFGNPAVWLFPGFAMFWIALRDGRYLRAGLSSLIPLIKLQYLPIAALVGVIVGGRRYLLTLLLLFLLLTGLSALLFGPDCIVSYPLALKIGDSEQTAGVFGYLFQNIRGSLSLIFGATKTNLIKFISQLVLIAGTAIIGLIWYVRKKISYQPKGEVIVEFLSFELLASVTVLLSLLTSLHTYIYDYEMALLPAIWLWIWATDSKCKLSNFKKKILKALVLTFPLSSWLFFFFQDFFRYSLHIQPFCLWATVVLTLAIEGLIRDCASGRFQTCKFLKM